MKQLRAALSLFTPPGKPAASINDEQTQTLPRDELESRAAGVGMNADDRQQLTDVLSQPYGQRNVRLAFNELIGDDEARNLRKSRSREQWRELWRQVTPYRKMTPRRC